MQGLVASGNVERIHTSGERLDALPLDRQAEAGEVGTERLMTVLVPHGAGEALYVVVEPALLRKVGSVHAPSEGHAPGADELYDTVETGGPVAQAIRVQEDSS